MRNDTIIIEKRNELMELSAEAALRKLAEACTYDPFDRARENEVSKKNFREFVKRK